MFCISCGSQLPDDSVFCSKCGKNLSGVTASGLPHAQGPGQGTPTIQHMPGPFAPSDIGVPFSKPKVTGQPPKGPVSVRVLSRGSVLMERYEIVSELGRGGMGIVYRAVDNALGVEIALKTLPAELRHDDHALDMLKKEVKTSRQLTHDNICRVHDFQQCAEANFVTMELIDGPSLDKHLSIQYVKEGKGFELKQVLQWLESVCRALDYAHGKKVAHRDLKPGNVLLDNSGIVKLNDFGLARAIRSSMTRYSKEAISGTILYMSPEQCLGKPSDMRSDVYSLGMLTYELLIGKAPFEKAADVTYCQLHEPVPQILDVPQQVNAAIATACAKKKEERFDSAGKFFEAMSSASDEAMPVEISIEAQPKSEEAPAVQGPILKETVPIEPVKKARETGDECVLNDMECVWVSPDTFNMGSAISDSRALSDELPQHQVTLTKGFWLGKYPVTKKQWHEIMDTNPWKGKRDVWAPPSSSAVFVSWEDVQEYIDMLNIRHGDTRYRLPTEAEWECACRAGSTTAYCFGEDPKGLDSYAWYGGKGWLKSAKYSDAASLKKTNDWGVWGMHGNVWEWCNDWHGPYKGVAETDPKGAKGFFDRIIRGGSWRDLPQECRSASRKWNTPTTRSFNIGFRLVAQEQAEPS